jgi:hypothetical protein
VTTYNDILDYDGDWTYYGAIYGLDDAQVVVEMDLSTTVFAFVEDDEFTGEQYESAFEYEDPDGPLGVGTPINYAGEQVTWTDITDRVQAVQINRGKFDRNFDGFSAGTATITLIDENADFIPSNTGGAYYPNVRPMRPIRVTAVFSGESKRLFRGYVDAWDVEWSPGVPAASVTVTATDAFKILTVRKTTLTGTVGDTPGERATDILDAVSWPTTFRDIDSSGWSTPLAAWTGDEVASLTALQALEFAEAGALYVQGDGKIRFRRRSNTYREGYDWVFTDTPTVGAITYQTSRLNITDDRLANKITLTNVNDVTVTREEPSSQDVYEVAEYAASNVLTRDEAATANLATIIAARDGQPLERLDVVQVNGRGSLSAMNLIVTYELMDKALIELQTPGGYSLETTVYLTAVSHDIRPKSWTMTFTTNDDFQIPQEWQQVDPAIAWADVDATLTWLGLAEGAKVE